LSLGHAFGSSPACRPFADDTGTAAEPISFETAPKLGAIAAAGIPLRVEQQEIGLGERLSKATVLSILRPSFNGYTASPAIARAFTVHRWQIAAVHLDRGPSSGRTQVNHIAESSD
jgi:hypothetical protein